MGAVVIALTDKDWLEFGMVLNDCEHIRYSLVVTNVIFTYIHIHTSTLQRTTPPAHAQTPYKTDTICVPRLWAKIPFKVGEVISIFFSSFCTNTKQIL